MTYTIKRINANVAIELKNKNTSGWSNRSISLLPGVVECRPRRIDGCLKRGLDKIKVNTAYERYQVPDKAVCLAGIEGESQDAQDDRYSRRSV
jgi:hypothetical protein